MRTLAVDLGTRRVGLALSDEGGRFATPYEVLIVSSPAMATEKVAAVAIREGAGQLVVGVPINMDGSIGGAAESAIQWAKDLGRRVSLPVVLVDERLSSFSAEEQLIERKRAGEKLTRGRKKKAARRRGRRHLPASVSRRQTYAASSLIAGIAVSACCVSANSDRARPRSIGANGPTCLSSYDATSHCARCFANFHE